MQLTGEQFVQELMTRIEERSFDSALTKINYNAQKDTDSVGDGIDLYDWHDWYINAADYDESGISLYISSDYDELASKESEIIAISSDDIKEFAIENGNRFMSFEVRCHDNNESLYILLKN